MQIDSRAENVTYSMIYRSSAVLYSLMMYVCTYQKGGMYVAEELKIEVNDASVINFSKV